MNIYRVNLRSSRDPNDRLEYLGLAANLPEAVKKAEDQGRKAKKLRDADLLKEDRLPDETFDVETAVLIGPRSF